MANSSLAIGEVTRAGIDAGWLVDQVVVEMAPVVDQNAIVMSDEYREAAERLVDGVVTALVDPEISRVDLSQVLAPLVEKWGALAPETVTAIESLPPVEIRPPSADPPLGPDGTVTTALTVATGLGAATMTASGLGLAWLAENRRLMIRSLLNRMTVSALTFALMLRVGSWVVDPRGGRSPLRAVAGEVLATRWWLPAMLGATAGIGSWTLVRTRRRVSPSPD